MLREIHFLLTYQCNFECDHCFLHCGPSASGTFTAERLREAFRQIAQVPSIGKVYFEGGEPFLYYALLLAGVRMARAQGLEAGIVTNSYWATTEEDAALWLRPLAELGIADLAVSDDAFHGATPDDRPAERARAAAARLGIPCDPICIEGPRVEPETGGRKGESIVGGSVMFRGRAAERLTAGLPGKPASEFRECPWEDLQDPMRVHVDPEGNVHLCQGLLMGNLWKTPLAELLARHDAARHPVCGPLLRGGPAELARVLDLDPDGRWVDACHLCYVARREARTRFPDLLGPPGVYGA